MSKKAYAVFIGHKPGVYLTWSECEAQVKGFSGAKYQGYKSQDEAHIAYGEHTGKPSNIVPIKSSSEKTESLKKPLKGDILTVDAAYSSATNEMEFRGVFSQSKAIAFHSKAYVGGTQNIGEFLALVEGVKWIRKFNYPIKKIYTDSVTAKAWVRDKKINSTKSSSDLDTEVVSMINEANSLLLNPEFMNGIQVLKWDTGTLGEIAADYGRKGRKGIPKATHSYLVKDIK